MEVRQEKGEKRHPEKEKGGGRRKKLCGIMNEGGGQCVCSRCLCAYMYCMCVWGRLIIDSMCYRRKLLGTKKKPKRSESETQMRGVPRKKDMKKQRSQQSLCSCRSECLRLCVCGCVYRGQQPLI